MLCLFDMFVKYREKNVQKIWTNIRFVSNKSLKFDFFQIPSDVAVEKRYGNNSSGKQKGLNSQVNQCF